MTITLSNNVPQTSPEKNTKHVYRKVDMLTPSLSTIQIRILNYKRATPRCECSCPLQNALCNHWRSPLQQSHIEPGLSFEGEIFNEQQTTFV